MQLITDAPRPADDADAAARPAAPTRPHRGLLLYHHLALAAVAINVAVFALLRDRGELRLDDGSALDRLTGVALVNLAVAVLVRNRTVLNAVYALAGRGRPTWPLPIRRLVSEVHHIGGLHAGCAAAGTAWAWLLCASVTMTRAHHPTLLAASTVVAAVCLAGVLAAVTICATPPVRLRAHNLFEHSHRWGGWSTIALAWTLTAQLALHGRPISLLPHALIGTWHAWLLAFVTLSIAWPWRSLRRVAISVERPSRHAAVVTIHDRCTPTWSSAVSISRHPLGEWHAFATVTTPGRSGVRLFVSRAGDWTGRFIDDPPSHVWMRGKPVTAPMARVALLYRRVVYVVTGSGIGPCLGQILANRVPGRLVWSTRDPRRTYGDALVDEVLSVQPGATIWDTTTSGKPDLLHLTLDAVESFAAEAVFIVSNRDTTLDLVASLERRGIPAFGPIWDS